MDTGRHFQAVADAFALVNRTRDPGVAWGLVGPAVRGYLGGIHREERATELHNRGSIRFDWGYDLANKSDSSFASLYEKAKSAQWNATSDLDWAIDVDLDRPDCALMPDKVLFFDELDAAGVRFDAKERLRFAQSMATWTLSQFLHGEQGALYAAAHGLQSVPTHAQKRLAAVQVADEARHVEAFSRYLHEKVGRTYAINDSLYVVLDSILGTSEWDLQLIGMQLIVEGLALSAFGNLYRTTSEPLLRTLLHRVLEDEARHVQFGVLSLERHLAGLSPKEIRYRQEWAFEHCLLMRDRFLADEIYDEWFGSVMSRRRFRAIVHASRWMTGMRRVLFGRVLRMFERVGIADARLSMRFERELQTVA